MTASVSDADLARMARGGLPPLTVEDGLALFDAAVARPEPTVVPSRINVAGLREQQALPALWRDLVPRSRRTAAAADRSPVTVRERLRHLDETGRQQLSPTWSSATPRDCSATPTPPPSTPNAASWSWVSTPWSRSACAISSVRSSACGCPPRSSSTPRRR
ncbi:hypothetical protein O1L55_24805 [Streptomyces albulus]|nr:hypothetical protein [Streptomyces noursei]